jgi:hypothetical protein
MSKVNVILKDTFFYNIGHVYSLFKSESVKIACYNSGWEKTEDSKCISRDLQIFLERTNRPLHITVVGVANVSMETYSSVSEINKIESHEISLQKLLFVLDHQQILFVLHRDQIVCPRNEMKI